MQRLVRLIGTSGPSWPPAGRIGLPPDLWQIARMSQLIEIRAYREDDLDPLIALFTQSVRQVASRDYSPDQIAAWAPEAVDRVQWRTRLGGRPTFVAQCGAEIVGFSDLESTGRIDMLFVHAAHQGRGVARSLLRHILAQARAQGVGTLSTEASLTARPFFERNGFTVIEAQDVQLRGRSFRNFRMIRHLDET